MLLAGGGPGTPDARVLTALTTPVIGQFDPAFTAVMDEVMVLARQVLFTSNARCFAVSALADGGLEALLNTLVEPGDGVAIAGSPGFVAATAAIARRYGARVVSSDELPGAKLLIVAHIDPALGVTNDLKELAARCRAADTRLIVDATLSVAAMELRVDDWHIDACVAGVDHAIGAPTGMSLVTYTDDLEQLMLARQDRLPPTSYLDLLQLQAYWSPDRLNHHTAPTSLVYGLREALRLVHLEGLEERWRRHAAAGGALREGLRRLGLEVSGDGPYAIVHVRADRDEASLRQRLREDYGVHVTLVSSHAWRVGLLGSDARPDATRHVLLSIGALLSER